ncbi:MAG: sigma-54 dependent transcriptional regulator [Sedimentisphaerales bacterium]|nr:sigma-54 dependent transcriptional regulator [Sedimentisphaerales bacterium]
MKNHILVADDEIAFRDMLANVLREEGMEVTAVANGTDAMAAITKNPYQVAILDIQMPGMDGIKVLREIMKIRHDTRVIMITAYGSVEMAVEAIKLGACDYVVKPVLLDDILIKVKQQSQYHKIQNENLEMKRELNSRFGLEQIIGETPVMKQIFSTIRKVAKTKSNVLITGESGTGKELVAHAIHILGLTNVNRFVAVNCGAIAEGILESELFGHKKGSFTSANENKKGFFEIAHGGTLFLDEIGYMPTTCQVKLLRAVEERQILPVGSTEPVAIDLRLIAATNKNLLNEIKHGRFREDLYYRLNVVGIHLPPLRERKEDIPKLVRHFINKYNAEMRKNCTGVNDEVMNMLMNYEWKGNIRELQNVIERAIIFADGDELKASDIGFMGPALVKGDWNSENLQVTVANYEREHISRMILKYRGNKADAAKSLGIGLSSLYRRIDELDIDVEKLLNS